MRSDYNDCALLRFKSNPTEFTMQLESLKAVIRKLSRLIRQPILSQFSLLRLSSRNSTIQRNRRYSIPSDSITRFILCSTISTQTIVQTLRQTRLLIENGRHIIALWEINYKRNRVLRFEGGTKTPCIMNLT